jgi:hypothetical protein
MMTKHSLIRLFSLFALLLIFSNTFATEFRHSFTITGLGGETGSGSFTWDDTVVANGNPLALGNIISGTLTVTGAAVPGGTQTFELADWTNVFFNLTPDFALQLVILADNGVATLIPPTTNYTVVAQDGAAWVTTLTFTPGATTIANPTPVPLLDGPALIFVVLLIALTGAWQIKRRRLIN